jgi:hypothetical protein
MLAHRHPGLARTYHEDFYLLARHLTSTPIGGCLHYLSVILERSARLPTDVGSTSRIGAPLGIR